MKPQDIDAQSLAKQMRIVLDNAKASAALTNNELLERLKNCQPIPGSKSNNVLTIFTKYMQEYLRRVDAGTMQDTIWITTHDGNQVLAGQYYTP